jgi:genome maintenance exonuclease 1
LERLDLASGRVYLTPEGNRYPSVTSILGYDPEKKKSLDEWRAKVGEDVANRISKKATQRGTALHSYVENFLLGNPFDVHMLHYDMWTPIESYLQNTIGDIHAIESQLYSNHLRSAGTVDLIAEHNGKLSIIDIKTSTKLKYSDEISHYYEQCAAYAVMFEELTGIPITNLVIIMGCDETRDPLVFASKRDKHIQSYLQKRKTYEEIFGV